MFESITLEMSLKPFKKTDEESMRAVIRKAYELWHPLTKDSREISFLLWSSDGSEILDYHGELDEEFEWSRYVGGANRLEEKSRWDPSGIGLHSRAYFYDFEPPIFTYRKLSEIVSLIKAIGREMYPEKSIRVGATFDPGPEFAISKFKYERHNEICEGSTMGKRSMVSCYSRLHADNVKYAAYPDGIPEGEHLAKFLGSQAECFLSDMGFDYLWFSNGFGFGLEPWSTTGAVFDGKSFDHAKIGEAREKILEFWRLFREKCSYPIETRGTNLTVGIDVATDGVPQKAIYEGGFNLLAPPNSPWAALDSNFGLELCGYLSRIAELPDDRYLFRFYVHDPWWANTPWTDRYDSLPHDIYLPMSLSRVDADGEVRLPTNLAILSIDNSFGEMPDFCAYEPSIHINRARRYAPDALPPVLWVYPFDEYSDVSDKDGINEVFFGDWFIVGAINHALPIGGVISTRSFVSAYKNHPEKFAGVTLISTPPSCNSDFEREITAFSRNGGRVIFYGGVDKSSEDFKSLIGVRTCDDGLFGELSLECDYDFDTLRHGKRASKIIHRPLTSSHGINTSLIDGAEASPILKVGGRVAGTKNKNTIWLSGTVSADYVRGRLLTPDDEREYYSGESLMRKSLGLLGYDIRLDKDTADSRETVMTISRHENAFMLATSARDTTVGVRMKFPLGAPIFMGRECRISDGGFGEYNFTRADFLECRIFVEQAGGVVSCHDINAGSFFRTRRIKLTGLEGATVRFFAPRYCERNIEAILNSDDSAALVSEQFDGGYVTDENGTYFEARGVSGKLIFCIPFETLHGPLTKVIDNVPNI